MSCFLILLAAGDSKRLKSSIPKPYQIINGKTLIEHSLNAFQDIKEIKKIMIVYNKRHKKYLSNISLMNIIKITGGKTRQKSTLKALKKFKNKNFNKVLIHDVARPNPPKKMIKNIIYKLKKNDAVIPVMKVVDATKRVQNNLIWDILKCKRIFKN